MGNVCSSGDKRKKDSISEKSDEWVNIKINKKIYVHIWIYT